MDTLKKIMVAYYSDYLTGNNNINDDFKNELSDEFSKRKINKMNMDWVLNMTPLNSRKKCNELMKSKNNIDDFLLNANEDELKYLSIYAFININK